MTSLMLSLAPAFSAPTDPMACVLESRAEQLSGLVVELRHDIFARAMQARRENDKETPDAQHLYRLTIVGSGALSEFLTDDPSAGYEPMAESITGGTYVSRHVRPNKFGMATFSIAEDSVRAGTFRWNPDLAAYDIQLMDCNIPGTNISALIRGGAAKVVGASDVVTKYAADVSEPGQIHHLEFEVAADGLATFVRDTLELVGTENKPIIREMTVRKTAEVGGVRIPTETWMACFNPNVPGLQASTHVLTATNYYVDPTLTAKDVTIPVQRRSAFITTLQRDGAIRSEHFDANGEPTDSFLTVKPPR